MTDDAVLTTTPDPDHAAILNAMADQQDDLAAACDQRVGRYFQRGCDIPVLIDHMVDQIERAQADAIAYRVNAAALRAGAEGTVGIGRRAIILAAVLCQEGILSEGQCASRLGIDRVVFRTLMDEAAEHQRRLREKDAPSPPPMPAAGSM